MITIYIFFFIFFSFYTKKDETLMLYLFHHKTLNERSFIVDSITHILNSINNFSKINFKFSKYIDLFHLLNHIPESISFKLNNNDFLFHLDQAFNHINWIIDFFDKQINPSLKKEVSKLTKSKDKVKTIPYADFTVDKPPVFKKDPPVQISFDDILRDSLKDGRPLKPIKRRNPDAFTFQGVCPFCGAPKEYIYDNNKNRGQFQCKACLNTFTLKTTISDEAGIFCPHCGRKLDLKHDRNGYIVYICPSYKCPYYLKNKELVDNGTGDQLKTYSDQHRLHYHYRDFKFNLDNLKKLGNTIEAPVNLAKIRFDFKILGLCLTYYVNYGLSSRKTALILKEVHGIKISHQTVINYATTVSNIIKPMVDNYQYKIGHILSGDETYIKVHGKNHYVFFWSDPESKIITSYAIYPVRDTKCACISIYDCLRHYDKIPDQLTLITDGNPIYNAAQLFFNLNDIHFDLHQVIGVKNLDEESKKYRPFKQIEERLNRTYKQNYYGTNGYSKLECANSYMILFVCFFNFFRQHSSLGYKTPVDDGLFEDDMKMQDKWLKLIELSSQYHIA